MGYSETDSFFQTEEELRNSPSRRDGIDEETETLLRVYGAELINESMILLKLPHGAMATGQVLFQRFYCKKSFARYDVKRVAAGCVWLTSKVEECPRASKHVVSVFQRMECRREGLPIRHLEASSKEFAELISDLGKIELILLRECGFICHVVVPHHFIPSYLQVLEAPPEMKQEAWNLANDSLRTTLCVRFKSSVVSCGIIYAAARRLQVPLPENPPWWEAFDADKSEIYEVVRALAHLYNLPKAQYIPECIKGSSLAKAQQSSNSLSHPAPTPPLLSPHPVVATSVKASAAIEVYQPSASEHGNNHPFISENSKKHITRSGSSRRKRVLRDLQNRSVHPLGEIGNAVKGKSSHNLVQKVSSVAHADIEDVLEFVGWLDKELSLLADESAVVKHLEWPKKKVGAMREAAAEYNSLKHLVNQLTSCNDCIDVPCDLKKMACLLEKSVKSIKRLNQLRKSAMLSYQGHQIPTDWMLDSGIISKVKKAMIGLAKNYVKRVTTNLESNRYSRRAIGQESFLLQGVDFAYAAALQFSGELDVETLATFGEIKRYFPGWEQGCQQLLAV